MMMIKQNLPQVLHILHLLKSYEEKIGITLAKNY